MVAAQRQRPPPGPPATTAGSPSRTPTRRAPGRRDSAPVDPAAPLGNGVRIDGFVREGGTRIAVNYTAGLPECYGTLDTPEVLETDAAVTVTLTLVPPEGVAEGGCPDIAMLRTVRIDLDAILGDRSVLDGSLAQPVRVREARRANE